MAWSEQTGSAPTWEVPIDSYTQWDDDATLWDVSGGVVNTYWDMSVDTWSEAAGSAAVWVEL